MNRETEAERGGIERWLARAIELVTWLGIVGVVVQMVGVSYGVFVRYVLRSPNTYVTEAATLILVPLAFAGMAQAVRHDALPRVTAVTRILLPRGRKAVRLGNLALMLLLGGFFTTAAGAAALRTYSWGNTSDVIGFPEYIVWVLVTLFLAVFVAYVLFLLVRSAADR